MYEAQINGQQITQDLFTPGWTSYNKRLQYQIYDVTDQLNSGGNAVGVTLGDGWYKGKFGWSDNWNIYGETTSLLFQLEVEYANGQKEIIISDESWKAATGPIVISSIYDGEVYDARLEKAGWTSPNYNDKAWASVVVKDHDKSNIVENEGIPVRRREVIKPIKIITTPKGETVVDMGQNMVGWVKLKAKGEPGNSITLSHAEVLDKSGNFYTDNLRSAEQIVKYIFKDKQEVEFEPHFTFQGFRYVKVEGFKGELALDNLTGIVIYSDMEKTGTFECSDPMVNQLQSNIEWGQRGNFLEVPTDCPQRDERMGWTGDAQAFASTAMFNFDGSAFFTKWLQDLKADQSDNGSVPFVIPDVLNSGGSTGWADAATIIPWTMYQKYGDDRILERQYESMKAWVGFLEELSEGNYLVQKGFHFGDWLFFIHPTSWNAKPGHTDIDFIATAFFAYSTQLTLETAKVLGQTDDVPNYEELLLKIKAAFQNEFVTKNGRLSPHSQTAYILALEFGLLTDAQISQAADYLVKDITARENHLSTGFLGTPYICHVLSKNGYTNVAYDLLLQKTYPSWLYPITRGATTIWERWDGIKPDSSFQTTQMNSFNHYAYGAIGDWLYRVVAGIEVDPVNPGYQHILIQPEPTDRLKFAKADHKSTYGVIKSGWEWVDGKFNLNITIPPNTTATVKLPKANVDQVNEGGNSLTKAKGIISTDQSGMTAIIEVGSGNYSFSYSLNK
ncbi:MAG: glycoside hydrolase family 78 protein [Cyclobacteriaceae bacterium]